MPAAKPSWARLEPQLRDIDGVGTGVRAEIFDPLWMLLRQRQTRALRGEDAGSPVRVRLRGHSAPLTRFFAGQPTGADGDPWDSREPLERRVEAEPEGEHPLRLAATAGLHFLRLLAQEGVDAYTPAYLDHYPLMSENADPATARYLSILAGRAPDGISLHHDLVLAGGALPPEPLISPGPDTDAALRAATAFRGWYAALAPPAEVSSWDPGRFEYTFAVAAPLPDAPDGEVVFTATGYDTGRLDRDAFDLEAPGATLGAAADAGAVRDLACDGLPTPVSFPGAPVARFWGFENREIFFGDLTSSREDLTALLLIEFGLMYGNEQFVVPVQLGVGSVAHVTSLMVTDSFGNEVAIPHVSHADDLAKRPARFRLFESTRGSQRSTLFLLPPTLGSSIDGPPIEEVRLLRDEGANLAWAIEARAAQGPAFPIDRLSTGRAQPDTTPRDSESSRYRVRPPVPDAWLPLIPVRDNPGVNHLELGYLEPLDNAAPAVPWGSILSALPGTSIPEEEIGRAASEITRAWQYARWIDGRQHAWVGRRRAPIAPAGDSGLRFDVID